MSSALTLLTCVAESGTPQAVSDLAERTRLSKSTASRLAAELASCGVLIRSGRTGTYPLGARALVLAGAAAPYLVEVQVALGQLRP
ncbi:helix-turn-helix domain-containing protein [Streptomyces sp. NPDC088124]|uniref:helix-turn-helix domain-containing protein n=1 Tax=Streptomyces sp. NPDC088124 TaxID=3154654 RepID=UPI0034443DF0